MGKPSFSKKTWASIFLLLTSNFALADSFAWQKNIDRSCSATISGRAGGVFSKYGFWFDTAVSMDTWAQDMAADPPQEECRVRYLEHKDQARYMRCIAHIQDKWDWYRRCRPIVNMLSQQEGRK